MQETWLRYCYQRINKGENSPYQVKEISAKSDNSGAVLIHTEGVKGSLQFVFPKASFIEAKNLRM